MSKKKILVLGSNGFIGRNIVEYLSPDVYDIYSPKRQELNLLDTQAVESYMKKTTPHVVVLSAVNIKSLDENLIMYFNLERCSDHFGKLISIGSAAEYDMKNYQPMMKEDYFRKHIPSDTYGLSKFVISNDIESKPRNLVNMRVLGIYGKYEDYTRRFLSNNICRALAGMGISINRDMFFDFIYVNDFLKILELFINNETAQRNYNVCTGSPIRLSEIAQVIAKTHDKDESVLIKQEGLNPDYSADNSRLISEFGPVEFTKLETAVQELYDWYKNHPNIEQICTQLREAE